MYCGKCGHKNDDQARFCASCGAPLDTAKTEAAPKLDMSEDTGKIVRLVPGVWSSFGNGWRQMFKYFLELFLIAIIAWVIVLPSGAGRLAAGAAGGLLGFLALVYGLLILGPIEYGVSFAHLKAARGDKLEITDMFQAFQNYWNAVLANILVLALVLVGLILLIIPGIIFGCKLAFTPYLVVDQKMGAIEAAKASWSMTRGYAWKVFFIGLLAIPIAIVGLVLFIVGIIPAIIWIRLTFASLYHAVSLSKAQPG